MLTKLLQAFLVVSALVFCAIGSEASIGAGIFLGAMSLVIS